MTADVSPMLTRFDRYILRGLLVNYVIGLAVMMSLYVVLDLFVNMDEFTEHGYPFITVLTNMMSYYWPQVFLYFSQLSGVITLFACMATISRLRRLNELTAMLSSGVSLYRVARPVVFFGVATTALLVVDTEVLIPSVAYQLARDRDEVDGKNAYDVLFLPDRDNKLFSAGRFHPADRDVRELLVLTKDETGAIIETLEADRATWEPPTSERPVGRWKLERGRQITRTFADDMALGPRGGRRVTTPRYYESDNSPEVIELHQAEGWIRFLSLQQLDKLDPRGPSERALILHTKHARHTAPLVSLVLLFLGMPFFLNRSPANVLADTGKCLLVCGLCYVLSFVAASIRSEGSSALPMWIPIFVFGTVAIARIDRIKT